MPDWSAICERLDAAGVGVAAAAPRPVSGGDISAAWRLGTDAGDLFLKTGPASSLDMFTAEAEGLRELAAAAAVKVPAVIAAGEAGDTAFLALEWLVFESADAAVERRFGQQLAVLHRNTGQQFGWHRDNTIGLTPQPNAWSDDWVAFFGERRLGFQLRLAAENGFGGEVQDSGRRLLKRLPLYFTDYTPQPSLLHGDLWGGNWSCCDGQPVMFDPAVYYGDRETDLAMTRLFGGFGAAFYEGYETAWPLAPGSDERMKLYQLYHVLNHLNLFGSAYLGRGLALITSLLRE